MEQEKYDKLLRNWRIGVFSYGGVLVAIMSYFYFTGSGASLMMMNFQVKYMNMNIPMLNMLVPTLICLLPVFILKKIIEKRTGVSLSPRKNK